MALSARSLAVYLIASVWLVFVPSSALFADTFLPLWPGNTWVYDGSPGEHESLVVSGTASIWETEVFIIRYEESTHNDGLENYWTSELEGGGEILLWGWFRHLDDSGVLYRPPLTIAEAPLYYGKTWSCTTEFFTLPDTTYDITVIFDFEVTEEGNVTVPAGTFYAYRLGYVGWPAATLLTGRDYALTGEASSGASPLNSLGWWCQGVGQVQYEQASELYQLTDYTLCVSTAATTWGRIKSIYK
jgi:hypothetical protein